MKQHANSKVSERFCNRALVEKALGRGVHEALWLHKQLGQPVVIWRDGQVVWLPPEEIPVDGPPPAD